MIRLAAQVSDHGFTYTLAQDGKLTLTTGNAEFEAAMLAASRRSWSALPSDGVR